MELKVGLLTRHFRELPLAQTFFLALETSYMHRNLYNTLKEREK